MFVITWNTKIYIQATVLCHLTFISNQSMMYHSWRYPLDPEDPSPLQRYVVLSSM